MAMTYQLLDVSIEPSQLSDNNPDLLLYFDLYAEKGLSCSPNY